MDGLRHNKRRALANQKSSVQDVFLQSWMPPLLAGMLAFLSAYLIANRNDETTKEKIYIELKVRHADATATAFSEYVSIWRRLIIRCSKYEADKQIKEKLKYSAMKRDYETLNSEQLNGIQNLATKLRPASRDQLFGKLDVVTLYFSEALVQSIDDFRTWDELQQIKTCSQMPSPEDYKKYEVNILQQLKKEVRP